MRERILFFEEAAALARATASQLGLRADAVSRHRFPDGESLIRVECESTDRVLLFHSLDQPNQKLVEVLLAADAIRRQGVREISLVAPYLAYMRQDRVFHPGECLSQQVVAGLLDGAFDEIVTVEAHLHRIHSLSEIFSRRAVSLSAANPMASWLRQQDGVDLLVGPDSESEPWVRAIAERVDAPWIVAEKVRHSDRDVTIDLPPLPPDVQSAWIVDDIASSGATMATVAEALAKRRVDRIGAIVVHALFSDRTLAHLAEAGIAPIVSTDSIAHTTNAISLAPLLADRLRRTADRREGASCSA